MGVGDALQDQKLMDAAMNELGQIAGQKPAVRRAKKAISNFKLRAGVPIGCMVTLRGARMYEFYDRLINVALPRIRDFRGINPRSFDGRGNYSVGLTEQIIFPEINYDDVDTIRGLDVAITTTAEDNAQAEALLRGLGMPFPGMAEAGAGEDEEAEGEET
jgi:large subunit ribosomal protein L5